MPLLVAFLLVCRAELVIGWLLWQHRRPAGLRALALLPVEFVFWIGFALPLGPIVGPARTRRGAHSLVIAAPSRLRRVIANAAHPAVG